MMNYIDFDVKKVSETYGRYRDIVVEKVEDQIGILTDKIKNHEIRQLTMKEFFSLLWLNMKVSAKSFVEYLRVVYRYYGNSAFRKADLSVRLMYLFHNPYKISKRFLMGRNSADVHAYGETPLTSLEMIADEAKIGPKDVVYELGSGRGLTCFWLNAVKGANVVGIEYNPAFISRAQRVVSRLNIKGVKFVEEDFCEVELKGATVCYLYGTCLDDSSIKTLIKKFSKLPKGTKIITVSFALSDYSQDTWFELMHTIEVPYTWGTAQVFFHVVK
jgi:hypothetical protein